MTYIVCERNDPPELIPLDSQCHRMPSKEILQTDSVSEVVLSEYLSVQTVLISCILRNLFSGPLSMSFYRFKCYGIL